MPFTTNNRVQTTNRMQQAHQQRRESVQLDDTQECGIDIQPEADVYQGIAVQHRDDEEVGAAVRQLQNYSSSSTTAANNHNNNNNNNDQQLVQKHQLHNHNHWYLRVRYSSWLELFVRLMMYWWFPVTFVLLGNNPAFIVSLFACLPVLVVKVPVPPTCTCRCDGWCRRWSRLLCCVVVPLTIVWLVLVIRGAVETSNTHHSYHRLDALTQHKDPYTLTYTEDHPQMHITINAARLRQAISVNATGVVSLPKTAHAVLLLHGFSASPEEFTRVTTTLRAANISYYAPRQAGWGTTDYHLAKNVKYQDWIRTCIEAYDVLSTMADTVSIMGHSTGAPLAVYVASQRPVRHLVLSGPNIVHNTADASTRKMLLTPVLGDYLAWIQPVAKKPTRAGRQGPTDTLSPTFHDRGWYAASLPTEALREAWRIVDATQPFISRVQCDDVTVMMGAQDETVGKLAVVTQLLQTQLPVSLRHNLTVHEYAGAGHNWFKELPEVAAPGLAHLVTLLSH